MNTSTTLLSLLAGCLLLTGTAQAQEAAACPQLPADTGLTWEYKPGGDAEFCRALRADGSEAFGVYVSPKPSFEPVRSDRAERSQVDGQEVYWYRAEIATKPGVEARETAIELPDGRSAHVWLQAADKAALDSQLQMLQGLHFRPGRGNEQVAGQ